MILKELITVKADRGKEDAKIAEIQKEYNLHQVVNISYNFLMNATMILLVSKREDI